VAIGDQADPGRVNAQLSSLALQLRNWSGQVISQAAYLNKLGAAGLEAMGYSSDDAADVLARIDYMLTVAQVYKGSAAQPAAYPFEDALCSLWAAQ
jgi:hypothetical protein